MDHSLRAYLERQLTEELDGFLQDCLSGTMSEDFTYLIPIITEILKGRTQSDATG